MDYSTKIEKLLFSITALFIVLMLYSVITRFYSELIYPIERSSFWKSHFSDIPSKKNFPMIKKALAVSDNVDKYHFLYAKYLLFGDIDKNNSVYEDRYGIAEKELFRVLSLNPTFFEAYAYLGWLGFQTGNFSRGLDLIQKSIDILPGSYFPHSMMGLALYRFRNSIDNRYREAYMLRALEELNYAISLNNQLVFNPATIDALSGILIMNGKTRDSIDILKKLYRIDSGNVSLHARLANLYFFEKNHFAGFSVYKKLMNENSYIKKLSVPQIENSLKRFPENYLLIYMLVDYYVENNNNLKALRILENSTSSREIYKKHVMAELHYRTAKIHESMGNYTLAIKGYTDAIKKGYHHKLASQRLLEIYGGKIKK